MTNPSTASNAVSFVILCYNKEDHLERSIGSVLAQEGDFERQIICVNNGSTDRSPQIMADLLAGVENSKIIVLDKNYGVSRSLNTGVAAATLPLIKPLDGDDTLAHDGTLRLLQGLTRPDIALVHGRGKFLETLDEAVIPRPSDTPDFRILDDPLPFCVRHTLSGCSDVLFRRDAFVAAGGCDENIFIQDQSYLWRLALRHAFTLTDEVVYLEPRNEDRGANVTNRPQIEHDRISALYGLIRDHRDLPLSAKRLIARRAASRSWKWAKRVNGAVWGLDAAFWRYVMSFLPWLPDYKGLMRAALEPYRASGPVRLPKEETPGQEDTFKIGLKN